MDIEIYIIQSKTSLAKKKEKIVAFASIQQTSW